MLFLPQQAQPGFFLLSVEKHPFRRRLNYDTVSGVCVESDDIIQTTNDTKCLASSRTVLSYNSVDVLFFTLESELFILYC